MIHKKIIFPLLSFLWLLLTVAPSAVAQNNPYGIKDELYPIYERASNKANHDIGLLIADSLKIAARELGDRKAECLAYTIPLRYYMTIRNTDSLLKAVENMKEIAVKNGYTQYFTTPTTT